MPAGPDTLATRASLTVSVLGMVAGLPGSHGTSVLRPAARVKSREARGGVSMPEAAG